MFDRRPGPAPVGEASLERLDARTLIRLYENAVTRRAALADELARRGLHY